MSQATTQQHAHADDPALTGFDQLPNSALVRQSTLVRLLNCSDTTIWRYAKRGLLHPVKLSPGVTGFRVGEIRALLDSCTAGAA